MYREFLSIHTDFEMVEVAIFFFNTIAKNKNFYIKSARRDLSEYPELLSA